MRHPLWILNSVLLVMFVIVLFFMLLSRQPTPEWQDIEPARYVKPLEKKVSEINISKIYDYDLF